VYIYTYIKLKKRYSLIPEMKVVDQVLHITRWTTFEGVKFDSNDSCQETTQDLYNMPVLRILEITTKKTPPFWEII
jgi:hypothetical protein